MNRWMITYVIASIILLVLVYLVTFIQETQKRSNEVLFSFAEEAASSYQFDLFVKYQSEFYHHIEDVRVNHYQISFYTTLGSHQSQSVQQLVLFVIPLKQVPHAMSIQDKADLTQAVINDQNQLKIVLDTSTQKEYLGKAISYGIHKLGFYYYTLDIQQSMTLDITLYDYQGQVFYQDIQVVDYITDISENNELQKGYTNQEIESILDMNRTLLRPMLINITLFLVVDILFGVLFHLFLSKKKII
jgi:hypothetical protein